MDDDFNDVTWQRDFDDPHAASASSFHSSSEPDSAGGGGPADAGEGSSSGAARTELGGARGPGGGRSDEAQANVDSLDAAGIGAEGQLDCRVDSPVKEGDGTKDAFVSYLVTTDTDFKSFTKSHFTVRRRFTDFVFLFKGLSREYPACAVPPLPDKHKMEYVRGDRFGQDFTQRRAHSLHRFLRRLTLHPVLRRAALLVVFLESSDWNAYMRAKGGPRGGATGGPISGGGAGGGGGDGGSNGVFDAFADTFVNAFSKVHKPDKRFIEVREKADKLAEDLGHVEKTVARVARRETDLETDYGDLSTQFLKLAALEPGVEAPAHAFSRAVDRTARQLQALREHTDRDYLGSLRDMDAYVQSSLKALLKTREQKQLDFEGLTDYLSKAAAERDQLASPHGGGYGGGGGLAAGLTNPKGFVMAKIEDMRGVDHAAARREKLRRLELQIDRLTSEVESARRTAELFDDECVKEVADFDRIKAVEFADSLGRLSSRHAAFYEGVVGVWEKFLEEMEAEER